MVRDDEAPGPSTTAVGPHERRRSVGGSAWTANGLRERLNRLGAPRPPPRRAHPDPPRGFEPLLTPYGLAWRRLDFLNQPPTSAAAGFAYLDTETTGLAGGTGTLAWAAAVARVQPGGLELAQLILLGPGQEPPMLHALQEEIRDAPGLATYNGASFDLPLLRTRWVLARMPGDLEHGPHTDLLRLARSLLRPRLQSCTLRTVELRYLGFEREEDLPGALAPEAYFRFLRFGARELLEAALEHNRQDVLSLYHLHHRLQRRLQGRELDMRAADWLALGRHLWRRGRRADAWRAFRCSAELREGEDSEKAAELIARRLRRLRRRALRRGRDRHLRDRDRRVALLDQRPQGFHQLGIEGVPGF